MKNLMLVTNRYIRGKDTLELIGDYAAQLGKKAMIIGGRTALSKAGEKITASLEKKKIGYIVSEFTTEVSQEQMEIFSARFKKENCAFVIAVGGGKAIDCAKWTAEDNNVQCITVPTCAATCAGMVSLIVKYNADGTAAGGLYAKSSPYLCLADTGILGAAPKRYIVSGIGDTLSKWPEIHYSMRGAPENTFNSVTAFLGKLQFGILMSKTSGLLKKLEGGLFDEDLDEVLDTIFFTSGVIGNTAGHEYRTSVAHGTHDGLITVNKDNIHHFLHGEKVAYGTLLQMALLEEDFSEDDLARYIKSFREWGLPVSITAFGLAFNPATANALAVASRRDERLQKGGSAASVERIVYAINRIEAIASKAGA